MHRKSSIFAGIAFFSIALLSTGTAIWAQENKADDGLAEAQKLTAADADTLAAQATNSEYPLYLSLMKASGLVDELGGQAKAEAALHALMKQWRDHALGARKSMPKLIKTALGEESAYGFTGIAASAFTGVVTAMVTNSLTDTGKIAQKSKEGAISMDVTEGRLALDINFEGKVSDKLNGKISTKIEFDRCPDADGKVTVKFVSKSSLGKPGGKGGANLTISVDGSLHYDDDSNLQTDWEADAHVEHAAFNGTGKGSFIETTSHIVSRSPEKTTSKLDRASSQATPDDLAVTYEQLKLANMMAMFILFQAEDAVKAGKCVILNATSDPKKRTNAKPSTQFKIMAKPRSKLDGTPTGGTVTAKLEGEGSLDPAGTKLKADADFNYKAPDEKQKKGVVKLEARSKRGVGLAELAFDTGSAAFLAQGGGGEYDGSGIICDLEAPFKISGSGVVNSFQPTSATGGTYSYKGVMSGIQVWGKGTYTVKLDPDGKSGTLVATGPGSVKTPMGTRTATDSEHYKLGYAQPCK